MPKALAEPCAQSVLDAGVDAAVSHRMEVDGISTPVINCPAANKSEWRSHEHFAWAPEFRPNGALRIPPRAGGFAGIKTTKNKKGSRDKISQPLELYGRDGVIRTLDP